MSDIQTFKFRKGDLEYIKGCRFGVNWPVVYLIEDKKELYVGETLDAYSRSNNHIKNKDREKLKNIHIISDEDYNKSAILDIEAFLIQNFSADGKFKLQNKNGGLKNHNYYNRKWYQTKFEGIWEELRRQKLAEKTLDEIKNSDLFKYSPYKALTEDQEIVADELIESVVEKDKGTHIVNGGPGTGKTILALYLLKYLLEEDKTKNLKVAVVIPMTSLRKTLKRVVKTIKGLKSNMIVGPSKVVGEKYDLLIVDEAHRLTQRKNVTNFKSYDDNNKKLGLRKDATQLDWILKSSKHQILFYDENQSIRPSDLEPEMFNSLEATHHHLVSQMRVEGGDDYIEFVDDLFSPKKSKKHSFKNYDFKIYDDIKEMVGDIKKKDKEVGLSRMVSGYAWPWMTTKGKADYDIEIDGFRGVWNTETKDWVNSPNAINEVGCIHTVQGYDLNYVGVIVGPEISYDKKKKRIVIDKDKYFDVNGKNSITDPEELERYIINIYKTLMTRGIKGTYLYVVDDGLREFFRGSLK